MSTLPARERGRTHARGPCVAEAGGAPVSFAACLTDREVDTASAALDSP